MLPIKILPATKLPLGARKIKLGARGADVKRLQELLAERGFFPAEPDGIFEYITDEAVREFQAAHRLRCDGIVGPKVIDVLLGGGHGQAQAPAPVPVHTPEQGRDPAQAISPAQTNAHSYNFSEVYVVTDEKNLSEVAAKLAIPVGTLASSNRTSVSAAVYPGQRLKINRRILGAWLEKRVTRLRKDIPALSLLVYPTAMIEVGGGLVQVSAAPTPAPTSGADGADASLNCPALVSFFGTQDTVLWQRFLKRRDWWKTWTASASAIPSDAAIAFESVAPRQSERRRVLRFLHFLGSHHVVFSYVLSGARPVVATDWLQQLTTYCDYIILWFDQSLTAEKLRGVLRRIIKKVPAGNLLLGIDLSARETVFNDDDDSIVAQNRLSYFEAQARAAGATGRIREGRDSVPLSPLSRTVRYRLKGQWRTLECLDCQAVIALCNLADEMGLAGAVLRGLEQGDTRLFRALSQMYALADPGWGRGRERQ